MFEIELDKSKNLLKMVFAQRVTTEETHRWKQKLTTLLGDLKPGFRLLTDLSKLESMDIACAPDIEWSMDTLDKAGISKVVRVIPDPRLDIGLNIMSAFHYRRCLTIVTCETLEEGLRAIELED